MQTLALYVDHSITIFVRGTTVRIVRTNFSFSIFVFWNAHEAHSLNKFEETGTHAIQELA